MSKIKKMKKWKIAVIIIVMILLLRVVFGIFFGKPEEFVPMVDACEVTEGSITSTLDTSGTIVSEVTRVYASPVNAQVGEIPIVLGQSVHKGEYLLTYDTASLQKSYDIAELQAKAESAASNDTLAKSSQSAGILASSSSEMQTLQGQIDALNAEIASLQAQATDNEMQTNNNAALNGEISALTAELEAISAQISELTAKKEQGSLSSREQERLKQLQKDQKSKKLEIDKKQNSLRNSAELANNLTSIQAQLTQKNNQLAELQSKYAEAQSKNAAAEAGILSEAARENISYTQQAGKLTLEQTADDLSRAKAGVTADFEGIVTEISASAGTMAAEGTPMVTLASAKDMCVEVLVSKYNLTNLKVDQEAVITFGDKEYQGTVAYISKIAQKGESGAAMVSVKIHINQPDDNLILGLDAKVSVNLGTVENVLIVPISSVNSDTQGDFVYVINNDIVEKKYVTAGMASSEEMEIKSGVEKGEKVVLTVDSSIIEGMKVMENEQDDLGTGLTTEAAE